MGSIAAGDLVTKRIGTYEFRIDRGGLDRPITRCPGTTAAAVTEYLDLTWLRDWERSARRGLGVGG